MAVVIWSERSRRNITDILLFMGADNERVAQKVVKSIFHYVEILRVSTITWQSRS